MGEIRNLMETKPTHTRFYGRDGLRIRGESNVDFFGAFRDLPSKGKFC